jgi:hypothetical protein
MLLMPLDMVSASLVVNLLKSNILSFDFVTIL